MEVMYQTCRHLMDKKPKLGLTFASHGAQIQGGESSEIYFEQICLIYLSKQVITN